MAQRCVWLAMLSGSTRPPTSCPTANVVAPVPLVTGSSVLAVIAPQSARANRGVLAVALLPPPPVVPLPPPAPPPPPPTAPLLPPRPVMTFDDWSTEPQARLARMRIDKDRIRALFMFTAPLYRKRRGRGIFRGTLRAVTVRRWRCRRSRRPSSRRARAHGAESSPGGEIQAELALQNCQ